MKKVYIAASGQGPNTLVAAWNGTSAFATLYQNASLHQAVLQEARKWKAQGFTPVVYQKSVAQVEPGVLLFATSHPEDLSGMGKARDALENLLRVERALKRAQEAKEKGDLERAKKELKLARFWSKVCPGLPQGARVEKDRLLIEAA